jgi:hypothetical protein
VMIATSRPDGELLSPPIISMPCIPGILRPLSPRLPVRKHHNRDGR